MTASIVGIYHVLESDSNCSSEVSSLSISTHNTLLAGDTTTHKKNKNRKATSECDLRIDPRQLDPDDLWKRKKSWYGESI